VVAIGEREHSRASGPADRRQRNVRGRGDTRNQQPRIRLQALPAHEHQSSADAKRATQIGERHHGIVDEHHAESTDDRVESFGCEYMTSGIVGNELDVGHTGHTGTLSSDGEHRLGHVNPDRRGREPRRVDRGRTAAASDIEHHLARREL